MLQLSSILLSICFLLWNRLLPPIRRLFYAWPCLYALKRLRSSLWLLFEGSPSPSPCASGALFVVAEMLLTSRLALMSSKFWATGAIEPTGIGVRTTPAADRYHFATSRTFRRQRSPADKAVVTDSPRDPNRLPSRRFGQMHIQAQLPPARSLG